MLDEFKTMDWRSIERELGYLRIFDNKVLI